MQWFYNLNTPWNFTTNYRPSGFLDVSEAESRVQGLPYCVAFPLCKPPSPTTHSTIGHTFIKNTIKWHQIHVWIVLFVHYAHLKHSSLVGNQPRHSIIAQPLRLLNTFESLKPYLDRGSLACYDAQQCCLDWSWMGFEITTDCRDSELYEHEKSRAVKNSMRDSSWQIIHHIGESFWKHVFLVGFNSRWTVILPSKAQWKGFQK